MPDQGHRTPIEPGIPEGTNAGLVSSAGGPLYPELGAGGTSGQRGPLFPEPGAGRTSGPGPDASSTGMLDRGKSWVADGLHNLGDRIEHTGRDLESGSSLVRPVGRVLDRAGNSLEGGANYLRTHGFGVIGDDFVEGIRHHPLVSAGVAVGIGWMLGRVLGGDEDEDNRGETSSRHEQREESHKAEDTERDDPSTLDRIKGRVTELVASGIASAAARRIRDRIVGD